MSAHGPPPPAAPSGRPDHLLEPARTRTGLALLHHEGSGSPCDVRLKLTREVLTIQKQDVVCVRGSSHGAHEMVLVTIAAFRALTLGQSVRAACLVIQPRGGGNRLP